MDEINKVYNELILESYIKKIQKYVENFECACISASRNKLINITDKTIIDSNKNIGDSFTKEENRHRNTALKSCLLKLGYGVTSLDGRFAEAGGKVIPGKETSYFVVNLNNDPNFYKNLFELSEKFNQDAFLYKPLGTMNAILVGTNSADRNEDWGTPGYNQTIEAGEFNPNGFEGALSKMGNKAFQFRINPNKEQTNTFIGTEILSEETFNKLSILQKDGCTKTAKKYLKTFNNIIKECGNSYSATRAAYFSARILKDDIILDKFFTDKNAIINENIVHEFEGKTKGGIIVFSTEVNAVQLSENKMINWIKQHISTLLNKLMFNKKINNISQKNNIIGWTIGKFFHGRYYGQNKTVYDEKSLSLEILGVSLDELILIGEELCRQFNQETVLIKDYSSQRIILIDGN